MPAPRGLLSRTLITASSATAVGTLLAARSELGRRVDPTRTSITIHLSSTWAPHPARLTAVYQFVGTDCDTAGRKPVASCGPHGIVSLNARSAGTCVQRGEILDLEAVLDQDHDPVEHRLYGHTNDAGGYYLYSSRRAAGGAVVEPPGSNLTGEWLAGTSSGDEPGTMTYRFAYDLIYSDGVTPPPGSSADGSLNAFATGRVAVMLDGEWAVDCFSSRGVVVRGRMVQGIAVIGTG